jgi:putative hydrolase of the HAD superfamily
VIRNSAADPDSSIQRIRRHARPLNPIPTGQKSRLDILPDIRAILFDVYGTLFISASGDIGSTGEGARAQALGQTLKALGIPAEAETAKRAASGLVEAIVKAHQRLEAEGRAYPEVDIRDIFLEVLQDLWKRAWIPRRPDRELCELVALEYECRINPIWPMPGLAETLGCLKEKKFVLGIVSNAQFFTPLLFPAFLEDSLETLGFDPELCVWSYIHLEAKPSGKLFEVAAANLGRKKIPATQVLYVGNDRTNDIWPAGRVGFKTALFAGDRRSFRPREQDPRSAGAKEDVLLTRLRQLTEVLALG